MLGGMRSVKDNLAHCWSFNGLGVSSIHRVTVEMKVAACSVKAIYQGRSIG